LLLLGMALLRDELPQSGPIPTAGRNFAPGYRRKRQDVTRPRVVGLTELCSRRLVREDWYVAQQAQQAPDQVQGGGVVVLCGGGGATIVRTFASLMCFGVSTVVAPTERKPPTRRTAHRCLWPAERTRRLDP
jgi:hypothetical protein